MLKLTRSTQIVAGNRTWAGDVDVDAPVLLCVLVFPGFTYRKRNLTCLFVDDVVSLNETYSGWPKLRLT